MRVPLNLIKTGKYTTGGEFVFKSTNASYKGYYYELNGSYFIGKEFKENADEIIKIKEANTLLSRASTFMYSYVSGITSQQLARDPLKSIQPNMETDVVPIRYFARKTNVIPINIKEISLETYDSVKNDPLYQTTFISKIQSIDKADTQMPGLKLFLFG
jgi:hypothetical protein